MSVSYTTDKDKPVSLRNCNQMIFLHQKVQHKRNLKNFLVDRSVYKTHHRDDASNSRGFSPFFLWPICYTPKVFFFFKLIKTGGMLTTRNSTRTYVMFSSLSPASFVKILRCVSRINKCSTHVVDKELNYFYESFTTAPPNRWTKAKTYLSSSLSFGFS